MNTSALTRLAQNHTGIVLVYCNLPFTRLEDPPPPLSARYCASASSRADPFISRPARLPASLRYHRHFHNQLQTHTFPDRMDRDGSIGPEAAGASGGDAAATDSLVCVDCVDVPRDTRREAKPRPVARAVAGSVTVNDFVFRGTCGILLGNPAYPFRIVAPSHTSSSS
jgi:hypothetical protein